jgi:hypothetical protein
MSVFEEQRAIVLLRKVIQVVPRAGWRTFPASFPAMSILVERADTSSGQVAGSAQDLRPSRVDRLGSTAERLLREGFFIPVTHYRSLIRHGE